jgi:hypothetical protein
MLLLGAFLSPAFALPELQLGPGSGSWSYDLVSGTWQSSGNPLELAAYAWDRRSNATRTAYLVIAAMPETTLNEPASLFDVTVVNDAAALSLYSSGNGAPPLSDPNGLAPHGIFPTYFEIYEFGFDGSLGRIGNTQPGQACTGSCQGYTELFDITIHSMDSSVTGLHFDLFTIQGGGQLNGSSRVYRNAPFSHDAETGPLTQDPDSVPEPSTAVLLIGCAVFAWARQRILTH